MKIYPSLVQCNYCNKWCNKSETAKSDVDRLTNDDIDKVFLKDWGIEDDD